MSHSKTNWLLVALFAAPAAFCYCGFVASMKPTPAHVLEISGPITSAIAIRRKGSIQTIRFELQGSHLRFLYPNILPNIEPIWSTMRLGDVAIVQYTGDNSNDPDIWGLTIDGHTFLRQNEAHDARAKNAFWALGLAIVFTACCGFALTGMLPNNSFKPKPLRGSA